MTKAIITGDLIDSTRIEILQRVYFIKQFEEELNHLAKDFAMRSEIYRGDSFQSIIEEPINALKIALLQKTFIRSFNVSSGHKMNSSIPEKEIGLPISLFDVRIAIGIGEVEVLTDKLASSSGEAFHLSGQLLDKMKNKKQTIGIATGDKFNEELETEFILLDTIISKTTALQCVVIYYKLLDYTEHQIAKKLNIGQSAVNQRSISGNWNAIESMLKRFEKIYSNEK